MTHPPEGSLPADLRELAVALSHADRTQAPVVVAKGYGVVAESIVREARAHQLFVHTSPDLVRLLMQVQLDREIPTQLYRAVAELMAWVHGIERGAETQEPAQP